LGIQIEASIHHKNTYYIDLASSPLYYTGSNFGFTTALPCCTTKNYWGKYKEELPSVS